jgi:hypothetical protein
MRWHPVLRNRKCSGIDCAVSSIKGTSLKDTVEKGAIALKPKWVKPVLQVVDLKDLIRGPSGSGTESANLRRKRNS